MLLFYIVTALSLIVIAFDGSLSENVKYCADCRGFLKDNCRIGRTGYSCINFPDSKRNAISLASTPPKTTNMSVCIPDDLTISGM